MLLSPITTVNVDYYNKDRRRSPLQLSLNESKLMVCIFYALIQHFQFSLNLHLLLNLQLALQQQQQQQQQTS